MKNQFEWTSLIAFGRYEELPEAPEFAAEIALMRFLAVSDVVAAGVCRQNIPHSGGG